MNEYFTCLALNCIATVGGSTISDALADDIFKLLISPTSQDFVRKKAALTILRLYRRDRKIIPPSRADRIIAQIDSDNLGVATSVASLVSEMVQENPDAYKLAYSKVVRRLQHLVFENGCPEEYYYYTVPAPWFLLNCYGCSSFSHPQPMKPLNFLSAKSLHKSSLQTPFHQKYSTKQCPKCSSL